VLLMIVWANAHGMCLLGIFAAGAFAAGSLLENMSSAIRVRQWSFRRLFNGDFPKLAALTFALILSALVNPSGYHLFFLGARFTNDPYLKQVIAEMLPPPFFIQIVHSGAHWAARWYPLYFSFYLFSIATVLLLILNRFRLPCGADYILLAFFMYEGLRHLRLLPLFAISAAGPAAFLAAQRIRCFAGDEVTRMHRLLLAGTAALAMFFIFAVGEPPPLTFFKRNIQLLRGNVMSHAEYPEAMMKYIIRTGFPDRMFSEINYCGYMIWWLSPEHHKLFSDNRFDVFGSRYFLEETTVVNGLKREQSPARKSWKEILQSYGVNFIVISRGAPVNVNLQSGSDWNHVYYYIPPGGNSRDDGFNIYLRNSPQFEKVKERARHNFQMDYPYWPTPPELDAMTTSVLHVASEP
jgi:hypothetical protein